LKIRGKADAKTDTIKKRVKNWEIWDKEKQRYRDGIETEEDKPTITSTKKVLLCWRQKYNKNSPQRVKVRINQRSKPN
jgi:hypothetical protein